MIISDLYGKIIFERISDAESFKLDIKFLPAGVYLISIDGRYSKKIIKL
ncbi:MAG: T9SS type A sorting domain-containing protein [Bacteroidetes bacterium]|nr:T9SS type A sorting domain-containing protein [Bacteroidota bacterium]MBL0138530.1 T9SS type A sorting domain-containing protein [Bacteroidota bacterium]